MIVLKFLNATKNLWLLGVIVLLCVGVFIANQSAYHKGVSAGKTQIVTQSKEAGKVAHAKARKAHRAAKQPGAVDRVLAKYCRDCN
jgi:membrane protein DedA with SNARE-associated domain